MDQGQAAGTAQPAHLSSHEQIDGVEVLHGRRTEGFQGGQRICCGWEVE